MKMDNIMSLDKPINEAWTEILQTITPYSTQVLISKQCTLLGMSDGTAKIGFKSKHFFSMLKERLPNIEESFNLYFGKNIKVTLKLIE